MILEPGAEAARALRGSFSLGIQSVINAGLGAVFLIALAQALKPDQMGIFAGLEFILALFSIPGSAFGVVGAYVLPRLGGDHGAREVASLIAAVAATLAGAVALLVLFQSESLSIVVFHSSAYGGLFRLLAPAIFLVASAGAFDGLLQGLKQFGALSAFHVIGQLARVASGIALLALGFGIVAALIALMINGAALMVLDILLVRPKRWKPSSIGIGKEVVPYLLSMVGGGFVVFLSGTIDVFVLVLFGRIAEAGAFRLANAVSGFLGGFILAPMAGVLLPAFSTLVADGGDMAAGVARASRYYALVFAPAAIGLAASSYPAVRVLAGEDYFLAAAPLAILSLSSILLALISPVLVAFQAGGFGLRYFTAFSVAVAADLFISLLSVPTLGMFGALAGRICLILVLSVGALLASRGAFRPTFDWDAWKKSLGAATIMGVTVYLEWLFARSVIALLPMIISGFVFYAIALKFFHAIELADLELLQLSFRGKFGSALVLVVRKLL